MCDQILACSQITDDFLHIVLYFGVFEVFGHVTRLAPKRDIDHVRLPDTPKL
jgi:hypothetical protein